MHALRYLDRVLEWSFQSRSLDYVLIQPKQGFVFHNRHLFLTEFSQQYGYFSLYRPIVSKVTQSVSDTHIVLQLLASIRTCIKEQKARDFAVEEVIAKVLAYRALPQGMQLSLPVTNAQGDAHMVSFTVDETFDLWHGMPAFGLVPENAQEASPILLFRGTDFSLWSEKGWASVLSDLDVEGPGLSTFQRARPALHSWLLKRAQLGRKARAIGYSLGGVFVTYTALYEHELLGEEPSVAFDPPGISKATCAELQLLPKDHMPLKVYTTRGDMVSKMGVLCGEVYELSTERDLGPIGAHVSLFSAEPTFCAWQVDVCAENASRASP